MNTKRISLFCILMLAAAVVFAGGAREETAAERPDSVDRIALILIGRSDDLAWNTAAYQGVRHMEETRGIEATIVEEVSDADVERVLRDFAAQGYELIIAHSFNYGDAALRVAGDFPNTYFLHGDAPGNDENIANYSIPSHEGGYLAGMIAGSITESNSIGIVNSFDIPSMIMVSEAFKLGVEYVNPDASVHETFVGAWDDAPGGREAAEALMDGGADFIMAMGNHTGMGAIEGAAARGVKSAGLYADQNDIAPDYVVTSIVNRFDAIIEYALQDIEAGNYANQEYHLTMPDGAVELAPFHNLADEIPQNVKDLVEQRRQEIISGEFEVPIITTTSN